MARIQGFKRIVTEDFSEKDRPIADKIGYSVNIFADDVSHALDKNLTIEDNLNMNKVDLLVLVDSAGKPTSSTQFKTQLNNACAGIQVIKAESVGRTTVYPTGTPFISFTEGNSIITVNNITNLPTGTQFKLKLLLIG